MAEDLFKQLKWRVKISWILLYFTIIQFRTINFYFTIDKEEIAWNQSRVKRSLDMKKSNINVEYGTFWYFVTILRNFVIEIWEIPLYKFDRFITFLLQIPLS